MTHLFQSGFALTLNNLSQVRFRVPRFAIQKNLSANNDHELLQLDTEKICFQKKFIYEYLLLHLKSGEAMSSISSLTLPPILEYFHSKFTQRFPEASGYIIKENTGKAVTKRYRLRNSFLVCSSTIKWHLEAEIIIAGSRLFSSYMSAGSSLLAARVVDLKAPKLNFVGTITYPVIIVALESLSLQATVQATVKNLRICLLKGAKISLNFESLSECENSTLHWLEMVEGQVAILPAERWTTADELSAFINKGKTEEAKGAENSSKK